jgi:hypothetical protein
MVRTENRDAEAALWPWSRKAGRPENAASLRALDANGDGASSEVWGIGKISVK